MRENKRMELNIDEMEQLEAVSGGFLPFGPDDMDGCEHPDYIFSGSLKEKGGDLYRWGHCTECSWSGLVQLTSKADGIEENLFASATIK